MFHVKLPSCVVGLLGVAGEVPMRWGDGRILCEDVLRVLLCCVGSVGIPSSRRDMLVTM